MNEPDPITPASNENHIGDSPLEWVAGELDRLRASSACIDHMATAPDYDEGAMARAIHCLGFALPRHFTDEGNTIFPLLRMGANRDDDLENVLNELSENHGLISVKIGQILPRLSALKIVELAPVVDPQLCDELIDLAERGRRHLALMTAIVLPIARVRLRPSDLNSLRQELMARRNQA